jgi:hypothetical protein
MSVVSSVLMEQTWMSVGAASVAEFRRMQEQSRRAQEQLTAFVIAGTDAVCDDAMGLALYVYGVVLQAFIRSGSKLERVKPGAIDRAWADNAAFVAVLQAAGNTRAGFPVADLGVSEPAVLQYIVAAFTEINPADPLEFSDADFWQILRVVKTAADCLHGAARPL